MFEDAEDFLGDLLFWRDLEDSPGLGDEDTFLYRVGEFKRPSAVASARGGVVALTLVLLPPSMSENGSISLLDYLKERADWKIPFSRHAIPTWRDWTN